MTDDSKATPSVGRLSLAILDYCESHHTQDWRVSQVSSMIGDWLAARALHDEAVNAHDALVAERDQWKRRAEEAEAALKPFREAQEKQRRLLGDPRIGVTVPIDD